MPDAEIAGLLDRVLVVAPTPKDGAVCLTILAEGNIQGEVCADVMQLCRELERGAGAAILTEEALGWPGIDCWIQTLKQQPPWSDLPIMVLTANGANSEVAIRTMELLGNVTLLERPVRVSILVSAVRAALRARHRQYQIQDLLAEAEQRTESLREEARHKDEFLAMLAHELRNPLASVRNAVVLLGLPDLDEDSAKDARGLMNRQIEHLARLVDDLLDVSRVLRGKIELRRSAIELRSVVDRALEAVLPLLVAQKHRLSVSLPAETVWLNGDLIRLAQVLGNVLNNAAKYTPMGGEIAVTADLDGQGVWIRVRDSGVGIEKELLPRIFDLFTQADRSIERSQGGLGIGLTLVKNLVEMHGGTVVAKSAGQGRGSEFVICLPTGPVGKRKQLPDWKPQAVRKLRILVVEDNIGAANILAKLLQRIWHHEVFLVHEGWSAISEARRIQPELILLDIGLPGLSGYEVAQRLRELPEFQQTLLVALTGYGQAEDRARAVNAGFDEHLVKPVGVDLLDTLFRRPKLEQQPAAVK